MSEQLLLSGFIQGFFASDGEDFLFSRAQSLKETQKLIFAWIAGDAVFNRGT